MKGSQDDLHRPAMGGPAREPSLDELRALADHARQRLALYQRRMNLGRGEPIRLAEFERIAQGAADRLRRAVARANPSPSAPDADAPASARPHASERQGEQ